MKQWPLMFAGLLLSCGGIAVIDDTGEGGEGAAEGLAGDGGAGGGQSSAGRQPQTAGQCSVAGGLV